MDNYWLLALTLFLSFWVGFKAGHLVTSFQYETNDCYNKSGESDKEIDQIESVEN